MENEKKMLDEVDELFRWLSKNFFFCQTMIFAWVAFLWYRFVTVDFKMGDVLLWGVFRIPYSYIPGDIVFYMVFGVIIFHIIFVICFFSFGGGLLKECQAEAVGEESKEEEFNQNYPKAKLKPL